MARNTATSKRITGVLGVASYMPYSLFCWAKAPNTTAEAYPLQLSDVDQVDWNRTLGFRGETAGDPLQLRLGGSPPGTTRTVNSAGSYSANTWHACGGSIASTTSYTVYLDGTGTTGTSAAYDGITPTDLTIGAYGSLSSYSSYLNQDVAEVAGWRVALSGREHDALRYGYCAARIRPADKIFHMPLITEVRDINKIVGTLSDTGTTQARHCRRIGFMW